MFPSYSHIDLRGILEQQQNLYRSELARIEHTLRRQHRRLVHADALLAQRHELGLTRKEKKKLQWSQVLTRRTVHQLQEQLLALRHQMQQCAGQMAMLQRETAGGIMLPSGWQAHPIAEPYRVMPALAPATPLYAAQETVFWSLPGARNAHDQLAHPVPLHHENLISQTERFSVQQTWSRPSQMEARPSTTTSQPIREGTREHRIDSVIAEATCLVGESDTEEDDQALATSDEESSISETLPYHGETSSTATSLQDQIPSVPRLRSRRWSFPSNYWSCAFWDPVNAPLSRPASTEGFRSVDREDILDT